MSCSDLIPIFDQLEIGYDEAFLEESAINSLARSIKKKQSGEMSNCYRFIVVNLDDPTLLLGRFMANFERIQASYPNTKVNVYAIAATGSERILKKCQELKVIFIAKPINKDKLRTILKME